MTGLRSPRWNTRRFRQYRGADGHLPVSCWILQFNNIFGYNTDHHGGCSFRRRSLIQVFHTVGWIFLNFSQSDIFFFQTKLQTLSIAAFQKHGRWFDCAAFDGAQSVRSPQQHGPSFASQPVCKEFRFSQSSLWNTVLLALFNNNWSALTW